MAINKVNTKAEEQSFKFLKNQSSILHTIDTNRVTVNGVNVIVDKPKRGDVMCITRYKENGVLLDANKQKVIWIDGLSIEPTQLSQEYEPVGICFAVNDNKALVRYREEKYFCWANKNRFELPTKDFMKEGIGGVLSLYSNGQQFGSLELTAVDTASRQAFVAKLNAWFLANDPTYSVELVELDTDLPAVDTSDVKDGGNYRNRIVISTDSYSFDYYFLDEDGMMPTNGNGVDVTAKNVKEIDFYYLNNGFRRSYEGGCCRAKYYDFIELEQSEPFEPMVNINYVDANYSGFPVTLVDFTDHEYCQILRDNFANYDEYFDSMMVKYPCGAGGAITEFQSGKDDTYKLADCTYSDENGNQDILYPAANWAASISLNAPKLGKGNWWLPSAAEMAQMMRDVTYGTSFWQTEPDIVNRVIYKLKSISNSGWIMLDADNSRWTSSKQGVDDNNSLAKTVYTYISYTGAMGASTFKNRYNIVSPITIYEF